MWRFSAVIVAKQNSYLRVGKLEVLSFTLLVYNLITLQIFTVTMVTAKDISILLLGFPFLLTTFRLLATIGHRGSTISKTDILGARAKREPYTSKQTLGQVLFSSCTVLGMSNCWFFEHNGAITL